MSEACSIAQNLARNSSWCVFPCREDKTPATPHGFKEATCDPAAIAQLWRRYPGPLIGVATGAASRIAVLDIDVKHDTARAWWFQHQHRLPGTRTYRTRSGGLHLYFRHTPEIRCASGRPVLGLDVRGDGGYVIHWFAAGHECLDHEQPQPFPGWLVNTIWPPAHRAPTRPDRAANLSGNAAIEGVLRVLSEAAEGERNAKLHWAAHRMQERIASGQASRSDAKAELVAAARKCGLSEVESKRTIASAWGETA